MGRTRTERIDLHLSWLAEMSSPPDPHITPETAGRARVAWEAVNRASGDRLPVPAGCTGPDGEMFYAWDAGRHHLELEIIPDGFGEWFYRDRESEDRWSDDWTVGDPLPCEAVALLHLFY